MGGWYVWFKADEGEELDEPSTRLERVQEDCWEGQNFHRRVVAPNEEEEEH